MIGLSVDSNVLARMSKSTALDFNLSRVEYTHTKKQPTGRPSLRFVIDRLNGSKTCDIYDLQKWDGWGMVEVGTA